MKISYLFQVNLKGDRFNYTIKLSKAVLYIIKHNLRYVAEFSLIDTPHSTLFHSLKSLHLRELS